MPKWLTAAFALLLSLHVFSIQGQTVDDVIRRYENAMGGREKLLSIRSICMKGAAMMPDGNRITETVYKVQDKLYRADYLSLTDSRCLIYTNQSGWRCDAGNTRGKEMFEDVAGSTTGDYHPELDCAGPLINYGMKGNRVELLGKEPLDGKDCYHIKLTLKSGKNINYWIDPLSWYIVRETRKGRDITSMRNVYSETEIQVDYSGYGKTDDGYVFARTIKVSGVGEGATFDKIEINKKMNTGLYKLGNINAR